MNIILLLLGEETSTLTIGTWDFYLKFMMVVLGIVGLITAGLIILLSKRKEDLHLTETKRADANANLVKTRDQELQDSKKQGQEYKEELDTITVEYRTLAGINLKELFEFWERKEEFEGQHEILKSEHRRLLLVLEHYEKQYGKPK